MEPSRLPPTLHDCISNGILQMDNAAKLILAKMRREQFDEAAYYEFIRSDVAPRATPTYDSLNHPFGPGIELLWGIANRMTITTPPQKIQEYSIRMNQSSGRNETLKNLPEEVENTLKGKRLILLFNSSCELRERTSDFAEDMLVMDMRS
ncbi:unnamed protein product [Strongylus vulgaris]|uniref:Uncharacterized protein n=1 Tax=Strongylus vulgaris TaxID=40348 RepID=A0A3P7IZW7_STRVU|nr:unnamed protein product [Strongylus vulgaris]